MGLVLALVAFIVGGAFAILAARRRRHNDEDQPLAAATALAGVGGASALVAGAGRPTSLDEIIEEGAIPRWRRPSLRAARAASDRGPAGPTYQLAFNGAATDGSERRLVRYRVVRMMDGPDEIRSQEVGQLEENDEVEVLERYAGYVHVRTPDGTDGWVHRTTLGPAIGSEEPDADVGPPEFDLEAAFNLERSRKAATDASKAATATAKAMSRKAAAVAAASVPVPVPVPAPAAEKASSKGKGKPPTRRSRKAEPST
jgi:SH3-like domain-containing protein